MLGCRLCAFSMVNVCACDVGNPGIYHRNRKEIRFYLAKNMPCIFKNEKNRIPVENSTSICLYSASIRSYFYEIVSKRPSYLHFCLSRFQKEGSIFLRRKISPNLPHADFPLNVLRFRRRPRYPEINRIRPDKTVASAFPLRSQNRKTAICERVGISPQEELST